MLCCTYDLFNKFKRNEAQIAILFSKIYNADSIMLYRLGGISYVKRNQILSNHESIDKWKVLIGKGYNGGDNFPHQIMAEPIVAAPGSACTETYLILGLFDSEKEAKN